MSPEQAARLTDIVARVVRGELGSGAELMDLAWGSEEDRPDLAGLTLDEAKARVTAEFEARGYVVLP